MFHRSSNWSTSVSHTDSIGPIPFHSLVEIDMHHCVSRGDILRDRTSLGDTQSWIPVFLGNGHYGGCFDPLGAMQKPPPAPPFLKTSTFFTSLYHYTDGEFGMEYSVPIGSLLIDHDSLPEGLTDLDKITAYQQRLSLFEGALFTEYEVEGSQTLQHTQFISEVRKRLFVMRSRCKGERSPILEISFEPLLKTLIHYDQSFEGTATPSRSESILLWNVCTVATSTWVGLAVLGPRGLTEINNDHRIVHTMNSQEDAIVLLAFCSDREADDPRGEVTRIITNALQDGFLRLLEEHTAWWASFWNECLVCLPECAAPFDKIWLRSNYYLACSLSDTEVPHPPSVFGLADIGWPSYFPQDFMFLHQTALTSNHLPLARSTSCTWHDMLPHAMEYAQWLLRLPGAYFPWIPPLFDWNGFHRDGVPNKYYYEHHNQACVSKIVFDYFTFSGDTEFLKECGYPVLREIAHLYRRMLSFDLRTGQFEVRYTPSQSQDEFAPPHQKNYFDCLLSVEYALEVAAEAARILDVDQDLRNDWNQVLATGFAYSKLASGDHYIVHEGDDRGEGSQRYPVQLNPIALFPVEELANDPRVRNAYKSRYQLLPLSESVQSKSWSLAEFLLSSARMRNEKGFLRDFEALVTGKIADSLCIQFFESTGGQPYFMSTQALVMEAITECLVQWHHGVLEPFPLIHRQWIKDIAQEGIVFNKIRVPGAFLVSGLLCRREEKIFVYSENGGVLRLRVPGRWPVASLHQSDGPVLVKAKANEILAIETTAGALYLLVKNQPGCLT